MDTCQEQLDKGNSSQSEWPRAILHVDMDAFYVNVHILDHPEDAGIPLVVGGKPDQRGVVSSASYEAREFGVRSAMPTSIALRLCPNLKIVSANWGRIHECSKQVMAILAEYGPVEQMSVDEAYVDLGEWSDPEAAAIQIQAEVKTQTRLPCSIGLSTSKLVAKVASDYKKPEGCKFVKPGVEAIFLSPLPTRVLWGIGPRTAERLGSMGITNCGQLAAANKELLQKKFGRQAGDLIKRARGKDDREVQEDRGIAKTISQEWTFSQDVNDPERLNAQIEKMSTAVARSLQKRNLIAYTIRVKFRWDDFTTFTRQRSIEVGTDDAGQICHMALKIWEENWPEGQKVRLIGVGVSKLEEQEGRQLTFSF